MGEVCFPKGLIQTGKDVQIPMSQLLILMKLGKECTLDHSQTAELCLTERPQCLLLELEVSLSECQAHTLALCLIWIYQRTELNAARKKDFGSDELFSFLVWINKKPLPLLLVSKLWGTKMPEISSWCLGYWSSPPGTIFTDGHLLVWQHAHSHYVCQSLAYEDPKYRSWPTKLWACDSISLTSAPCCRRVPTEAC